MKLYLKGHCYRYAVEQILLTMFPNESPEYPESEPPQGGTWAELKLFCGQKRVTAKCRLSIDGKIFFGASATRQEKPADELIKNRLLQRIIKLSFYKAAKTALGIKPEWGALTGIRPVKIMTHYLESGAGEKKALSLYQKEYDVSPPKARLALEAAKLGLSVKKTISREHICLYVGIPFCPTRCAYCSFVSSSVHKNMRLVHPFLEALNREIETTARVMRRLGLKVVSLYIGGGTPTTLSEEQLEELFLALSSSFDISAMREFTVEAGRPDTITPGKLRLMADSGVTRLSINPQTMDDAVLEAIGRGHTARQTLEAVSSARSAGGFSLNMDLIAGLPGDNPEGFSHTLDAVLSLKPENITVHTLSRKKGACLSQEAIRLPDGAAVGEMIEAADNKLRAGEYEPYYLYRQKFMSGGFENTGWCKKNFHNIYNVCIMEEYCSIVSVGGAASTKLVTGTGRIERIFNPKYPLEYIGSIEKIIKDKEKIEVFYNGLRS